MHVPRRRRLPLLAGCAAVALAAALASTGGCGAAARRGTTPSTFSGPDVGSSFLTSDHCAPCHSRSPEANALTTALGDDASPHGLWKATPMANSFRDPYWRAQLAREIERAPAAKAELESFCARCHAPMASHAAAQAHGVLAEMEQLASDPLAVDGVSCTACHQVQPDGLGTDASFNGQVVIRDEMRIFGPFEAPAPGPMRMNTGFTPTHGPHVSRSALCGACHTLFTTPAPGAAPFLEQGPYLEWRNSVYSDEQGAGPSSRSCQQCHMADLGTMKIARMPTGDDFNIAIRDNVRGHLIVGGNAWLIDLLRMNAEELGVTASPESLLRAAAATRAQLAHATARLSIEGLARDANGLAFDLHVENLAGHKLPSGYPARRAWLEVEVRGEGRVLFHSGAFDGEGRLVGIADELAIPHVDRVERPSDVVVYEMVARDLAGRTTTALLDMAGLVKDSRLLPKGWKRDGPHAAETAPAGTEDDPSFTDGADRVRYSIRLDPPVGGRLTVVARLRYQPMAPAWVDSLRTSRTREAADFLRMHDRARLQPETLALAIGGIE